MNIFTKPLCSNKGLLQTLFVIVIFVSLWAIPIIAIMKERIDSQNEKTRNIQQNQEEQFIQLILRRKIIVLNVKNAVLEAQYANALDQYIALLQKQIKDN